MVYTMDVSIVRPVDLPVVATSIVLWLWQLLQERNKTFLGHKVVVPCISTWAVVNQTVNKQCFFQNFQINHAKGNREMCRH